MADHALKTALGGAATGAAVGAVGGPWGALIGGGIGAGAGLLSGLFGGDDPSGYATARGPTAEQARRFAATEARREEASRLYGRLGSAAAMDEAQKGALVYGRAGAGPGGGGQLAGLRGVGVGSDAARLEGDIAGVTQQQAISREAQLEKKRVEMVKLANQLRKSGADPKEVARVMEGFAGGDPELRKIAASEALATDRGGLGGFLEGVTDWFTA